MKHFVSTIEKNFNAQYITEKPIMKQDQDRIQVILLSARLHSTDTRGETLGPGVEGRRVSRF